jgi:hypothetical protein
MRASKLLAPLLLAPLLLAAPRGARAQSAENAAAAEALFREGKGLVKEGKVAEGCAKLEASQRLDPAAGTLLNLADCHEILGRTASAWAEFSSAAGNAKRKGDSERETVARGRADALEPRLVRIQVNVPAASRVPGLELRRDGLLLDAATWGSATPVDPGAHVIVATAPGKRELRQNIDAQGEGKTVAFDLPLLVDAPVALPPGPGIKPAGPAAPPVKPIEAPPPPPPPSSSLKTIGYITGGAGVAGLVAGSVLGLLAKGKWADASCENKVCATQAQQDDAVAAKGLANGATGAFIAGGVLAAAGLTLVLVAPSSAAPQKAARSLRLAPQAGAGAAGLLVGGQF